jgi:Domain of unknown function (DUF1906)
MPLPGQVENAEPFVPGFDTDTAVTAAAAHQFFSQGYRFCLRYLSLGVEAAGDLTANEAADILSAGLAIMPVQHAHAPGWSPSADLGEQDGEAAAANALSVGFPTGVNIWFDLEGVDVTAAAQDVIDHCTAWFDVVEGAGFKPGLYVGADAILSGRQLFDLPFQSYWRAQSVVPDIPVRGYQLFQFYPSVTANGIGVDLDMVQTDHRGGQAQWLRVAV